MDEPQTPLLDMLSNVAMYMLHNRDQTIQIQLELAYREQLSEEVGSLQIAAQWEGSQVQQVYGVDVVTGDGNYISGSDHRVRFVGLEQAAERLPRALGRYLQPGRNPDLAEMPTKDLAAARAVALDALLCRMDLPARPFIVDPFLWWPVALQQAGGELVPTLTE